MAGTLPQPDITRFSSIDPILLVRAYLLKSKSTIGVNALQTNLRTLASQDALDRAVIQLLRDGQLKLENDKLQPSKAESGARAILGKDAGESWERIRAWRLPILALGLDPDDPETRRKVATPNSLKTAIVAVAFDLPKEMTFSSTQVRSELVWLTLRSKMPDIVGHGPFASIAKSNVVDRTILAGLAGAHAKSVNAALAALAARAIGAPKGDIDLLRARLVRIALDQAVIDEVKTASGGVMADAKFSDRIKGVARTLSSPPFKGRVAIAQIYDAYGRQYPDAGSLASFKERLVAAAKARELSLSRLDLPEYMDGKLRERSHTAWGSDEVHFVVTSWE